STIRKWRRAAMPDKRGTSQTNRAARRHHVVPQFYLRHFASDGVITCASLQRQKVFTQSVRKAASVNNFHSIPGHPDGEDAFERTLASVEGSASKVVDKVSRQGIRSLSPEERTELASFAALQYVRSPTQRRTMEYIRAQMLRLEIGFGGRDRVASWARENLGVLALSEEFEQRIWDEATRKQGPPVKVSAAEHIAQMGEMIEELTLYLVGRPISHARFTRK